MFSVVENLIDRLFARRTRIDVSRRAAVRSRLGMEGLEGRDCPAGSISVWLGGHSTDFDDPDNWGEDGPPEDSDAIIYFYGAGAGPFGKDELYATGGDCDGFNGTFKSIFVMDGYEGTITLDGGVTVTHLQVEDGTIDQPAVGADITVAPTSGSPYAGSLVWTGGTINSTSYAASVTINGSAASIAPVNAGVVSTGSTMRFVGGSTGVFSPGTTNFTGGEGVDIGADCYVSLQPTPEAQVRTRGVDPSNSQYRVRAGGYLVVDRFPNLPGPIQADIMPVYNEGTVRITDGALAVVRGRVQGAPSPTSFYQPSGGTSIRAGSTLRLPDGMLMTGGELGTFGGGQVPPTIDGNMTMTGGTVVGGLTIPGPAPTIRCDTLRVMGDVNWSGGTYRVFIDGANSAERSYWYCDGTFTVGAQVTINVAVIINPNNVPQGRAWQILEGRTAIVGAIVQPNPNVPGYSIVANNPQTIWSLNKQ